MAAGYFGEGVEGLAEIFAEKVAAELHLQASDDSLKMLVGSCECIVMAGVGYDDVGIGSLRCSVYQLLPKLIKPYAVLSLEMFGFVLDTDDGLVAAYRNVGVGSAWYSHHNDDEGTLYCCY